MGYASNFDTTYDAALGVAVISAQAANNTTTTAIFDLSPAATDFTLHVSVYGVGTAATDYTVVTIMGSTTADFSAGNYVLGHFIVGDSELIGTTFGAAPSADRGTGHYAVRLHNAVPQALESSDPIVCRYIRMVSKTVGATSTLNAVFNPCIGR